MDMLVQEKCVEDRSLERLIVMSPQVNFTPSNGNWFQKQQSPFEKKAFHFRIDAFTLFTHVEPVIEKHVKSLNSI